MIIYKSYEWIEREIRNNVQKDYEKLLKLYEEEKKKNIDNIKSEMKKHLYLDIENKYKTLNIDNYGIPYINNGSLIIAISKEYRKQFRRSRKNEQSYFNRKVNKRSGFKI